jgi:hypothetical protein
VPDDGLHRRQQLRLDRLHREADEVWLLGPTRIKRPPESITWEQLSADAGILEQPRPRNGSFGDSLVHLVREHGYDFNSQFAHTTTPTCLFATYVDRLSWLSYLMILEGTPELVWSDIPGSPTLGLLPHERAVFRQRFASSVLAYWNSTALSTQQMRLGLWDALVQLLTQSSASGLRDHPDWMLQRWPLELINWPVRNSQRLDVGVDPDFARSCSGHPLKWSKPSRK